MKNKLTSNWCPTGLDTEYVLCIECGKEWIDTDAVWIGEPRGARCEICVPDINGHY